MSADGKEASSRSSRMSYVRGLANQTERPLIAEVQSICTRLAPFGWRELLLAHGLDISLHDLEGELTRPLAAIDRDQPGFEDFSSDGKKGIEPGNLSSSLLYHALASPNVTHWRQNGSLKQLQEYPTLAEIELVENYVFSRRFASMEDLRARSAGSRLAIVVFACEYRPGADTVHRRHADMCFSRTGISRIGTAPLHYNPAARGYVNSVDGNGTATAVLPCRYVVYIAAQKRGSKHTHGPMHFKEVHTRPNARDDNPTAPRTLERQRGDDSRDFWIPVHKLFDGKECVIGQDLRIRLAAAHLNEKIRRAHLFFGAAGHDGGWREPEISEFPFVITEGIAEFSGDPDSGNWLLVPQPHDPLVQQARFRGSPLTYNVPASTDEKNWRPYQSSLNLMPTANGGRSAPEYLHARHAIRDDRTQRNLNSEPDVIGKVRQGGYRATHYIDHTADGCVVPECPALSLEIPQRLPAYSIVASPDWIPKVRQSDLVAWTDESAPLELLSRIWPINPGRPDPLSAQRVAANLELPGSPFVETDDTMTAIVGPLNEDLAVQGRIRTGDYLRSSMLPDGAAGVFSPGWDVSFDRTPERDTEGDGKLVYSGTMFLNNYGLGSPFIEDSMLCAALSSFWPAVAPDITRTFAPNPRYSSSTPLIDEVIGMEDGEPWDGIRGPRVDASTRTVEYLSLAYGDYVEAALENGIDISQISQIEKSEYIARTLTMAMVYEALGLVDPPAKAAWSLLSFKIPRPEDQELGEACKATQRMMDKRFTFRFEMIRHNGNIEPHGASQKFNRVIVRYTERVLLFADPTLVLRRSSSGEWAVAYDRQR